MGPDQWFGQKVDKEKGRKRMTWGGRKCHWEEERSGETDPILGVGCHRKKTPEKRGLRNGGKNNQTGQWDQKNQGKIK